MISIHSSGSSKIKGSHQLMSGSGSGLDGRMQGSFMSCLLGIVISYFAETLYTYASGLIAVVGPSAVVDVNGVVAPPEQ